MEIVRRNGCRCPLRGNAGGWPLVRRVLSGEGEGRPCASLWRVDCLVPLFGVCRTGCPIPLSCEESAGGCFLRRGEGLVCRMPRFPTVPAGRRSFFFYGGSAQDCRVSRAGAERAAGFLSFLRPPAGISTQRAAAPVPPDYFQLFRFLKSDGVTPSLCLKKVENCPVFTNFKA